MSIPVERFLARLHCYLSINGTARENWPRVGLEAFAAGVPVVTENKWGWQEMIEHGVTGFLGNDLEELAHYASLLAHDEELRLEMAHAARSKLINELACPEKLWDQWSGVLRTLEP
jgi:glycosyltransferase involved in cell wall biosynthesis